MYLFLDSQALPYVMNSLKLLPTIGEFRIGTNASPAHADRRLTWLPGGRCGGATLFGMCVAPTVLDTRAAGSKNCGGQRSLTVRIDAFGMVNVLDYPIVGQLPPVCSG